MSLYKNLSSGDQKPEKSVSTDQRILVVDDYEDIRLFLVDGLRELGFLAYSASNGVEGLALLQEHSFSGILLDLQMPVMDGLTMLLQIQKESNAIPVIIMSADTTRSAMIKAIESGAKDFLTKPIAYEILKYKCLRLFT